LAFLNFRIDQGNGAAVPFALLDVFDPVAVEGEDGGDVELIPFAVLFELWEWEDVEGLGREPFVAEASVEGGPGAVLITGLCFSVDVSFLFLFLDQNDIMTIQEHKEKEKEVDGRRSVARFRG
jgi:hypothetical protein